MIPSKVIQRFGAAAFFRVFRAFCRRIRIPFGTFLPASAGRRNSCKVSLLQDTYLPTLPVSLSFFCPVRILYKLSSRACQANALSDIDCFHTKPACLYCLLSQKHAPACACYTRPACLSSHSRFPGAFPFPGTKKSGRIP